MIIATDRGCMVDSRNGQLLVELTLLINHVYKKGFVNDKDLEEVFKYGKMTTEELRKASEAKQKERENELNEILNGLKDLAKVLGEVADGE